MIRNVFLRMSWCCLLALGFAGMASAAPAELSDVRLSSGQTSAQVTLQLSSAASHKLFTLDGPDRIVVDLEGTRLGSNVRAPEGTGPVGAIRFGARPKGALRVVVELKSAMPVRAAWSGSRLVIDLGKSPVVGVATPAQPSPQPVPQSSLPPKPVVAAHAPIDGDRDVIIAIDAGHGGKDPGATGRNGTREKDVVLAIARALAKRIDAEPGMRAFLTRDSDRFLLHRDRMLRARNAKADVFVSVHADAIRDRTITGASVYVLSENGATDEAARWLAERENAADLMGGVSLTDKDRTLASVLLDLSQSANISASMVAAERVLHSLDGVGEIRKRQVKQAGFLVLKSPDIPSMLVETAYISNPSEERRLNNADHQSKLAGAIFAGLRGYFEQNPPPGTRFASTRRSTVASALASPSP
jgi:N-acetylmuramoyl-L-alanine amidase